MNPDRSLYLRELSRELNIPYGMLYKEEKNLVSLGILTEEKRGKVTLVSVNKSLPYFDELKSLITKTVGLGDLLKDLLSGLKAIRYALVYGSFASGEETSLSDVDLLIVGDESEETVLRAISQAEKEIEREVNYILWNEEEFAEKAGQKHHLLTEIARNPIIMLTGDEDEFRRAVKK
jgi:predicted nucleotidyltransferase